MTRRTISRMSPAQAKVVLDFMGVPIRDQGTKVTEIKKQLTAMANNNYDDFQRYYQLVVNHKLPDSGEAPVMSGADIVKVMEALSGHVSMIDNDMKKDVAKRIEAKMKTASDEIKEEARKEINKARKEFITHRVRVGNKPARTVGGVVPAQWGRLCQLVQSRKNILMVGPSGCGKTHVAGMLADAFDLDYAAQSCSAGISESVFTGWLLPTGENGTFNHVPSEFIRIYENGGIFLLDEFDNTDANLGVFLNMAIAQDHFFLPQRFGNTKVKKHKDFVVIAAANTFGHGADAMYAGRTKLDAATLDRFKIGTVGMTYDENVESYLVDGHEALLQWGQELRKIIDKHNLAKVLSTRTLIDAYDMIRDHDWTINDVQETYFADWAREERAMISSDLDVLNIMLEAA